MKIHCISILNRNGSPIYLRNFDTTQDDVKYHYLAYTSCDVIEERLSGKSTDLYLGLLQTIGDMVVYGYVLNTGYRIILVISVPESILRDSEIRQVFLQIHSAYIASMCNPFAETSITGGIENGKFNAIIAQIGNTHSN